MQNKQKHKKSFPKLTDLDLVDLLTSGLICVKQVFGQFQVKWHTTEYTYPDIFTCLVKGIKRVISVKYA